MDVHEPYEILNELESLGASVVRTPNESYGLADYWWPAKIEGVERRVMVERKQAGELLTTLGRRLDTQLLKYHERQPDAIVMLLQEGVVIPNGDGKTCSSYRMEDTGRFKKTGSHKISYAAYASYMSSRALEGIIVVQTSSMKETAGRLLHTAFNTNRTVRLGLNPYYTVRPKGDKYTRFLAGIDGIGPTSAKRMLDTYKTPYRAFLATKGSLENVLGKARAKKVWEGIGRTR